jgi:transcription-repair coupling factor (superfamily II helicase)
VFSSPSLTKFLEIAKTIPSLLIEGLWDAPKGVLLNLLQTTLKKGLLVVSSEGNEVRLSADARYFGVRHLLEFPSWETLPGDEIAPSPDLVGKRLETLYALAQAKEPPCIIAPLQAILQPVLPPRTLTSLCALWKVGEPLPFAELPALLTRLGYRRVPVVSDKGQFAVRGGILDLFPLASPDPYRLDFFGDHLEAIRLFDPVGQTSTGRASSLFLCPAAEERKLLTASLFDYLGDDPLVIFNDPLALEDKFVAVLKTAFTSSFKKLLSTSNIHYWTPQRAEDLSPTTIKQRTGRAFYTGETPVQPLELEMFGHEITTSRWRHPFLPVQELLPELAHSPLQITFVCASPLEEKGLKEKFSLPKHALFERGSLSSGFALADSAEAIIPTAEMTHRYPLRREKWRTTFHAPAADFHELVPGDLVVHFHHGIGKFLGIKTEKNHLGLKAEFLELEYSSNSKLLVPIAQSYLISRYVGASEEVPTLHALGEKAWQKTRTKTEQAILGYAKDLIQLQAEREVQGGFSFPRDTLPMQMFEEEFPYHETDDQLSVDRLVCGDVGYGKTEVAMRAAFKAAFEGKKQVAVLVPTTVLALQHFETFSQRMQGTPVVIRCISRFQSPREIKDTLRGLEEGTVDIVIGTHRLLSRDIVFRDLGLIIVDEEQRFGVRAKEYLKTLKVGVDCLTMTATPIPRTLYLSLLGARAISVIGTPPQDRLPIKSILADRDPHLIQNALLRELMRDGQAFFIHNDIETMPLVAQELQKLLPEARLTIANGQMPPEAIDTAFHTFKEGRADILIATTIVENGIDIPNANTILIDNAHRFGVADLYQLRGRVGRWNRPAFAYFLIPKGRSLPELSRRRLDALLQASGYGGGMKIAMRDLEIRGAGNLLGTEQSGHVSSVGFHLYCKLLKRAIAALKNKQAPSFLETKMEFPYDARLPEEYIPEVSLRLEIYHRFGEAGAPNEVTALMTELLDRFGPPPPPVQWLAALTRCKLAAREKGFTLLKFHGRTLTTERRRGMDVVKNVTTFPLVKTPEEMEKATLTALSSVTIQMPPFSGVSE